MRISHNRDKSVPSSKMGSKLKSVKSAKDLGVIISSDLSWRARVDAGVNRANKILGVVHRTPLGPSNLEDFSIPYKTLVRPILEYASPVWCPYLVKDIIALEKSRESITPCAWPEKYEARLKILNWPTLEKRRPLISLLECYKIVFGLSNLNFSDFFEVN